jgi:hypothetical protein
MNFEQPADTRELISDVDVGVLAGEFVNGEVNIGTPQERVVPSETLSYPTGLGMTFLSLDDPRTHVLTVTADPRVANNQIALSDSGSSLDVDINGVVKSYDLRRLSGVQVNTGAGYDTVTVPSDLLRRFVNVVVGGHTTLAIADAPAGDVYTLDAGTVTVGPPSKINPRFFYLAPKETINFSGLGVLTAAGDPSATAVVRGTSAGTATTVFGMGTVTVGSGGSTRAIAGSLFVTGPGLGGTDLTIDDSADPARVGALIASAGILGLAPKGIYYTGADLRSLTIKGGQAPSVYEVLSTPQNARRNLAMTLDTGASADSVFVNRTYSDLTHDMGGGVNGLYVNTANLSGTLNARSTDGQLYITADDRSDTTRRSATMGVVSIPIPANRRGTAIRFISLGYIDGLGSGQILYDPATMGGLTVMTGDSDPSGVAPVGNTVNVEGTFASDSPAHSTTIVMGGHHDVTKVMTTDGPLTVSGTAGRGDTVNAGATFGRLDLILGPLTVSQAGLNVIDVADPSTTRVTYSVEPDGLAVGGTEPIHDSALTHLELAGPSRDAVYNVQAVPGQDVTILAGSGNDTFNVSTVFNALDTLAGTVRLVGQGSRDTLTVSDVGTFASANYNLYAGAVGGVLSTTLIREVASQVPLSIVASGFTNETNETGATTGTCSASTAPCRTRRSPSTAARGTTGSSWGVASPQTPRSPSMAAAGSTRWTTPRTAARARGGPGPARSRPGSWPGTRPRGTPTPLCTFTTAQR